MPSSSSLIRFHRRLHPPPCPPSASSLPSSSSTPFSSIAISRTNYVYFPFFFVDAFIHLVFILIYEFAIKSRLDFSSSATPSTSLLPSSSSTPSCDQIVARAPCLFLHRRLNPPPCLCLHPPASFNVFNLHLAFSFDELSSDLFALIFFFFYAHFHLLDFRFWSSDVEARIRSSFITR